MPASELIKTLRAGARSLDPTIRFLILDVCERLERQIKDNELLMRRIGELRTSKVKSVEVTQFYEGETIFADWHERLSLLEYVYNPGNDGPWYRADDVWACIDPTRQKEAQK